MTGNAVETAHLAGGRVNQKERTRQGLLAAARALLAEGQPVTIARAAARALVSEPTAYRYYSDVRNLLRDALAIRWPGLEHLLAELRAMPSAEARARRAAEAMARTVLANEAEIRALIALSYAPPQPDEDGAIGVSRPAFRVALIDAVVEPFKNHLNPNERKRLQRALSVVIGAEAVLSLRDSSRCSHDDIVSTLGWSAYHLTAAFKRE